MHATLSGPPGPTCPTLWSPLDRKLSSSSLTWTVQMSAPSVSFAFAPSQHIMLPFHFYNSFHVPGLPNPSSWSIFSLKPSPTPPIPSLYSFSHWLLLLFYLNPSYEVQQLETKGKTAVPSCRFRCRSHSSSSERGLKMAACVLGCVPIPGQQFMSPFTKPLPGVRPIVSLWRAVSLPIPDYLLLNFVSKARILWLLNISGNLLHVSYHPMKNWSSNSSWNTNQSLNIKKFQFPNTMKHKEEFQNQNFGTLHFYRSKKFLDSCPPWGHFWFILSKWSFIDNCYTDMRTWEKKQI